MIKRNIVRTWMTVLWMAGMLQADTLDFNAFDFEEFSDIDTAVQSEVTVEPEDKSALRTPVRESAPEVLLQVATPTPARAYTPSSPSAPTVVLEEEVPQVDLPADLTVWEALEHIFAPDFPLRLNYLELLQTNEIARIQSLPSTFSTAAPMDWRIVMREIITPHGLDMMEDEDAGIVRLGSVDAVHERYLLQEQERLMRNRTRIEVNFSEGVAIYHALQLVRNLARVNMNFDYMAPADRGVQLALDSGRGEDAPEGPPPKLTTYATPENAPVEWRIVMREILGPHGYDFVEASGVVRPMTREAAERWRREQVDVKPMVTRIVRVYHMDPEQLVERLEEMGILKHSLGSIRVAHGWDSRGKGVTGSSGGSGVGGSRGGASTGVGSGGTMGGTSGGGGSIMRHAGPPSIIIRDIEENIDAVLEQVEKLDVRDRQIMIEARILDIGTGASRELGVLFDEFGGSFEVQTGYARSGERGLARMRNERRDSLMEVDRMSQRDRVRPETDDARNARFLQSTDSIDFMRDETRMRNWGMAYDVMLNPFQMNAVWRMLQSSDDVRVVSQPVLVLSDHAESFIRIETEEPYVELETRFLQDSGGATAQGYQWQTLNVGVDLRVMPEITSDGQHVRLSVVPRISANAGFVTAPDGSQRPRLDVRELDTRVTVRSGHTLLMGGLISSSGENVEQKVPFFGDVPLLGTFFRRRVRDNTQRNLVMLITPTILDDRAPDTGYEVDATPHFEVLREDSRTAMRCGPHAERMVQIRDRMERDRALLLEEEAERVPELDPDALRRIQDLEQEMMESTAESPDFDDIPLVDDEEAALDEAFRTMSGVNASEAFPPSPPDVPAADPRETDRPQDTEAAPRALREREAERRMSPTELRRTRIEERRRRHQQRIQRD